VKSLIPIVDRLRARFGIDRICIVADRGMISKDTIAQSQKKVRDVRHILGARMRLVKAIGKVVLSDPSPFESVYGPKQSSKDPSPLEVKEVKVQSSRYIVCRNEDQARKDLADRQARMSERGWNAEWARLKDDLDNLQEITVRADGQAFVIRNETRGDAGKAVQATGVALGSVIRPLSEQKK